jgi:hypothetical protein
MRAWDGEVGRPALLALVEPTPQRAAGFRKSCGKIFTPHSQRGFQPARRDVEKKESPIEVRALGDARWLFVVSQVRVTAAPRKPRQR